MDNANTKDYLDKIRTQVVENLKRTAFAPSVQMTDVPRDPLVGGIDDEADDILDDLDDDENKDHRFTKRRFDQYVEKPGELSESEDEEENTANGVQRPPHPLKRRNEASFRHLDAGDSGVDSGLATPREASSIADEDMDTTGDAKMDEAPDPDLDTGSPSAAEPESRAEEVLAEPTETAAIGQEQVTSAPISRQPSLSDHGEDTTMEEAQAPAPEPETKEPEPAQEPEQPHAEPTAPAETATQEEKPAEQPASEQTAEPASPKAPSSPKDLAAPEPAEEKAEAEAPEASAPAETKPEDSKEATIDKPDESSKQE